MAAGILNWLVRQATELEVNMNSVERVVEYERYAEEAPADSEPAFEPPKGWPAHGAIEVRVGHVNTRPPDRSQNAVPAKFKLTSDGFCFLSGQVGFA